MSSKLPSDQKASQDRQRGAVTEAKWKAQSLCRHVKLAGADSFQNGAEDAEDIVN